jgi:glycosyltransferase involved in cell wall biosynthesis
MRQKISIVFLDGPGDAIGSYRSWKQGLDIPTVTHVSFSGQFFDVCSELEARVLVISENARIERLVDGSFEIQHRGNPSIDKSGIAYHASELLQAARILVDIVRFRTDILLTSERPYPFLLHILRPFGVKVVFNFHCVLWRKYLKATRFQRLLQRWNGSFYRNGCTAIACVSEDIKRQVREVAGPCKTPFVDFLPWFREETFDGIQESADTKLPKVIMFAGRIEGSKGIFHLLDIAEKIRNMGRLDISFEICGSGTALQDLRDKVAHLGMSDSFVLRGYCDRLEMREAFGRAYVVIVPTTIDFVEGFNMVVVEALLAHRPVISSEVCPALEYVRDAVIAVPPDDWSGYQSAILHLVDDTHAYAKLQARAYAAGGRFLSDKTNYKSALRHIFGSISRNESVSSREITPVG